MHRQLTLDLLRRHLARPLDPREKEMTQGIITFVEAHEDCFLRSCLTGHITGSAWITDPQNTRTLLTHHRKLDKWLQLGGHADGGTDPREVALREGREESGLKSIQILNTEVFDADSHWIPERKGVPGHWHHDLRFRIVADPAEPLVISDESHDLAWVPLAEVANYNTDESVLRMIRKTLASAAGNGS